MDRRYVWGTLVVEHLAVIANDVPADKGGSNVIGGIRGYSFKHVWYFRAAIASDVERRVQLALVAAYSSMMLLANYHSYSAALIKDWETRMETTLPGVFRT